MCQITGGGDERPTNGSERTLVSAAVARAALYFTILEVALVNWMYNSSLEQFLKLFIEAIDLSEKAALPSKRVENIIKF